MPTTEDVAASSNHPSQTNGNEGSRNGGSNRTEIKLIAVRLKEAALDSPSFRASYNFYSSQVEQIEMWIDGLLKSLKRYPQHYGDFKEVNSVLLNQLIPDFIKTTPIDQDNTLAVLECTKMNLDSLWSTGLKDLAVNDAEVSELLTEFTRNHIKPFKDMRKSFDFLQNKFDTTLAKFASLSKTKEASALREDSFQLHEVRKSYVNAALDMCVETAKFLEYLDAVLMSLTDIVIKGRSTYDERFYLRVKTWSTSLNKSIDLLLQDMIKSRNTIEKATIAQFEPSRDLKEHNVALINPSALTALDEGAVDSTEKHGWLYMKTTVGKPARTIWVRRWVFVKSGVFGVLLLSPSKTFVQETDKIGVLLANIRYAAEEDRRFCFEIKTIESTVMFQAETLKELKEWMRVFSEEKKRCIDNPNSDYGQHAFGRYPPLLYEFACTSLTSADIDLTTSKAENANNDDETYTTVTTSHLSTLIGTPETQVEFRDPDLNTPMATSRSKLALIAHAFLKQTVVPTAVTANIWGSVNWGMYYMNDATKSKSPVPLKNNLSALATRMQYPQYYPPHLRNYDIQLKSLFDACTETDELVVAHHACLWTLNSVQELAGRCFVTTKNVYFYMSSTGFISLMKKPLTDIVAVDVTSEKLWEWIKVYDVQGLSIKGRIFLSDGKLLQKKLDMLINNLSKTKPIPEHELIPKLESIEQQELPVLERHQSKRVVRKDNHVQVKTPDPESSFQPFSGVPVDGHRMRTNFRGEFDLITVAEFNAPPKAVFHIMFGDHSSLTRDTITLVDADQFNVSPWYNDNNTLKRVIDFKMALSKGFINLRGHQGFVPCRCVQTIEDMVDGRYYRVEEERSPVKLLISGEQFSVFTKYVIIGTDAKSCKVLFYGNVKFVERQGNFLIRRIFGKSSRQFQNKEIANQIAKVKRCVEKLGSHGQVIKAIRTYGNLSQSDTPYTPKEPVVFHLTLALCIKYYFKLLLYFVSGLILNGANQLIHLVSKIAVSLSMNKVLVLGLAFSVLFNFLLMGRSTVSYWKERRHETVMRELRKDLELTKMERSISLNDMDLLIKSDYNTSSQCFDKFMTSETADKSGSLVDAKFREHRHQVALKRNELIVELKILEQVERELVAGSYKNFVLSELNLCKTSLGDMGVKNPELEIYCTSCIEEYKKMAATDLL